MFCGHFSGDVLLYKTYGLVLTVKLKWTQCVVLGAGAGWRLEVSAGAGERRKSEQ